MVNYGEYLFGTSSDNILESLKYITGEDIESSCNYKIFNRGYEYFEEGRVEFLSYSINENALYATVNGRREYDVEIYTENEEVYGNCSCEFYGVCKHIIAVLLYIEEEGTEHILQNDLVISSTSDNADYLKDHLDTLSKEELITLVMKFAPENYKLQIFNNKSSKTEDEQIFNKVEKKILKLFYDEELLCDPTSFENSLISQLEKLNGLENLLSVRIGDLLLRIMKSVNDAFDEGFLYVDQYYEDVYFESPQFNHFVISYIQQLPFPEKISFLMQLDEVLGQMSYSTFEAIPCKYHSCFSSEESKELAEYILSDEYEISYSLIADLYSIIEKEMSLEDKEMILREISFFKQDYLIALAELLIAQKRYQEASNQIEMFLSGIEFRVDDRIIELYLDLCIHSGSDCKKIAADSINRNPTEKILEKIKNMGIADMQSFEEIVRNKDSYELLRYYEKEQRFDDAYKMITGTNIIIDETKFSFFKRNKKILPSQSIEYFQERINENLSHTGESYYLRIAETIGQIKEIKETLAQELITDIRTNYKRRTKLMSILNRF